MGNQAALSGLLRVPRGRLFGAEMAVTVCKGIFDGGCMALSDISILHVGGSFLLSRAFLFIKEVCLCQIIRHYTESGDR